MFTERQRLRLFDELNKIGWRLRDGFIYAPNETMWLLVTEPWTGDLQDFRDRMVGRLERLSNRRVDHPGAGARSAADVTGLVGVLNTMLDSN